MPNRDLTPSTPAEASLSSAGLAAIDAYLQGLVDKGVAAGYVTLTARHGKLAHRSSIGMKDIARGEPMAADTMFRIFSMTKPVTAVAMMILHDQGLWSPDDPIEKHLPAFSGAKVFGGLDEDGKPILIPADHPPTLRELLTHTAGLTYGREPMGGLEKLYEAADVWRSADLAEMGAKLGKLPLAYQPGTKWVYSLAMDVQGAIIETLSGQTLPAFMQEKIFGPLGMVDTAFHTPPEKKGRLATLYRTSKSRGLVALEGNPLLRDYDAPPALASGGGGLVSTAGDYARFAQMLANGGEFAGKRIVSQAAVKQMMTNQLSDEMLEARYGIGLQQIRPGFGFGYNGVVFTDPEKAGVPAGLGTYHWDGAAGTWFWVDPTNDLIFVGMVQLFSETAPACQAKTQTLMADAILQEVHS
ncbi:beta-lactamase family protein [Phenylobacterium sp. 20VBR1]|uniref:Beta-lactamase family protein n=1 Tax=Phenylobacterium glaciei TaxID=2803784 RepID=A0A941HV89_9CAUL|nr:serine hydrolase domain-containing protein [Phenylobacterium glaciei]MBR7618856.1 beta-lactamase family protein [Phenylobacterium glaciei]